MQLSSLLFVSIFHLTLQSLLGRPGRTRTKLARLIPSLAEIYKLKPLSSALQLPSIALLISSVSSARCRHDNRLISIAQAATAAASSRKCGITNVLLLSTHSMEQQQIPIDTCLLLLSLSLSLLLCYPLSVWFVTPRSNDNVAQILKEEDKSFTFHHFSLPTTNLNIDFQSSEIGHLKAEQSVNNILTKEWFLQHQSSTLRKAL